MKNFVTLKFSQKDLEIRSNNLKWTSPKKIIGLLIILSFSCFYFTNAVHAQCDNPLGSAVYSIDLTTATNGTVAGSYNFSGMNCCNGTNEQFPQNNNNTCLLLDIKVGDPLNGSMFEGVGFCVDPPCSIEGLLLPDIFDCDDVNPANALNLCQEEICVPPNVDQIKVLICKPGNSTNATDINVLGIPMLDLEVDNISEGCTTTFLVEGSEIPTCGSGANDVTFITPDIIWSSDDDPTLQYLSCDDCPNPTFNYSNGSPITDCDGVIFEYTVEFDFSNIDPDDISVCLNTLPSESMEAKVFPAIDGTLTKSCVGNDVTFTFTPTVDCPTVQYQWYDDMGNPLMGETSPTLTLTADFQEYCLQAFRSDAPDCPFEICAVASCCVAEAGIVEPDQDVCLPGGAVSAISPMGATTASGFSYHYFLVREGDNVIIDNNADPSLLNYPAPTSTFETYCVVGLSYETAQGLGTITNGTTTITPGDPDVFTDGVAGGSDPYDPNSDQVCMDLSDPETESAKITFYPPLSLDIIPEVPVDAVCEGSPDFFLFGNASGGSEDYDFSWTCIACEGGLNASQVLSSTTAFNPNFLSALNTLAPGTYELRLTVTDDPPCNNSITADVTVTILPAPPANAGPDVTICEGLSTQLSASGGVSYSWSPATGLSQTNISNPVASPTSTTLYTVTVTDGNGCTASDEVEISVTPGILVTAVATCTNADPDQFFISISSVSGGVGPSYDLSVNGGGVTTYNGGTVVLGPFNHSGTGGAVLDLLVEDNGSDCETTEEVVEVLCGPPQDQPFCDCSFSSPSGPAGAILAQSDPGSFVTGGTSGRTQKYILVSNDVSIAPVGTILEVNMTGLFTGLVNGDYQVYAINYVDADAAVINDNLDANSDNIGAFVTPSGALADACFELCGPENYTIDCDLPDPMFDNPDDQVCVNEMGVTYTLTQTYDSYSWTVMGGTIASGGGMNDNFVTIDWGNGNSGSVEVTVTEDGCEGSTSLNVTLNDSDPMFDNPNLNICGGATETYTLTQSYASYSWTITNGIVISGGGVNDNFVEVEWDLMGTGMIQVDVTDANGCPGTETINVQLSSSSDVEAGDPQSICGDEVVDLTTIGASITGIVTTGEWMTSGTGSFVSGTDFNNATAYIPSTADRLAGSVVLTLTSVDPNGICPDVSDTVEITFLPVDCGDFPWNGNE